MAARGDATVTVTDGNVRKRQSTSTNSLRTGGVCSGSGSFRKHLGRGEEARYTAVKPGSNSDVGSTAFIVDRVVQAIKMRRSLVRALYAPLTAST